jgi:diguanylate cyclase (GGDEF)-like protein
LALTDHLTGLANRRLAIDRLQHALNQVGRGQQQLVVSMCDIDHFKSTNDLFGHAAGDSILVALADRLRSAIRSSDTAARLGGDEFLIISEGIDTPEAADVVIRRLHDRLCQAASATDHEWAERLERAWRNGRFVLRWSPVAALDGRILACRAVLSWIDDDGVERDPDELITVLSNGRLFGPVRHSLIRKALRQRVEWQRAGLIDDDFRVHVRVFARQLADIDLCQDLLAELRTTDSPPSSLVLDVEDQALMAGPGGLARLEELTDAGVGLYLDRFGAEAVPLERLTWSALAGIRLDPALVSDAWRDRRRAAVADCLLELGARAGLDLVVDGIDHPEQLEWLSGKPILGVAGPLVGGALKVDEMQDRLTSRSPLERRGSFRLT